MRRSGGCAWGAADACSVNWQKHLVLDPRVASSKECDDLLLAFLCDVPDRIGFDKTGASKLTVSSFGSLGRLEGARGTLGSDGADKIKAHPWFKGIDWDGVSSTLLAVMIGLMSQAYTKRRRRLSPTYSGRMTRSTLTRTYQTRWVLCAPECMS